MNPLKYRASLLRESYEEAVFDHPNYRAVRRWAKELGLHVYESQIRPSLDEVYIVRDQNTVSEVAALMVRREQIRRQMLEEMRAGERPKALFMPEERSPEYLERLGSLLNYPQCCVSAYIDDARDRVDSALRASNQLSDADDDVDPCVYFAAAFFPCRPRCEEAQAVGLHILSSMENVDDRFRERMAGVFRANLRYTMRYPEVLKRRRQQMMSQYMGVNADERE